MTEMKVLRPQLQVRKKHIRTKKKRDRNELKETKIAVLNSCLREWLFVNAGIIKESTIKLNKSEKQSMQIKRNR